MLTMATVAAAAAVVVAVVAVVLVAVAEVVHLEYLLIPMGYPVYFSNAVFLLLCPARGVEEALEAQVDPAAQGAAEVSIPQLAGVAVKTFTVLAVPVGPVGLVELVVTVPREQHPEFV